jgi:hypothetical protein
VRKLWSRPERFAGLDAVTAAADGTIKRGGRGGAHQILSKLFGYIVAAIQTSRPHWFEGAVHSTKAPSHRRPWMRGGAYWRAQDTSFKRTLMAFLAYCARKRCPRPVYNILITASIECALRSSFQILPLTSSAGETL